MTSPQHLVSGGVVYWLGCINGGLGQKVCELLKRRLSVLGGPPQLRAQESVCLLQRVEGCLHAKSHLSQAATLLFISCCYNKKTDEQSGAGGDLQELRCANY